MKQTSILARDAQVVRRGIEIRKKASFREDLFLFSILSRFPALLPNLYKGSCLPSIIIFSSSGGQSSFGSAWCLLS
jgi:hypothetical protein